MRWREEAAEERWALQLNLADGKSEQKLRILSTLAESDQISALVWSSCVPPGKNSFKSFLGSFHSPGEWKNVIKKDTNECS